MPPFCGVFHSFFEFSLWKTPVLPAKHRDFHSLSHSLWKTPHTMSGKRIFGGKERKTVINAQKQFANKRISNAENKKASTVYLPG